LKLKKYNLLSICCTKEVVNNNTKSLVSKMYCNNLEDLILKRHDYNQANELLILGGFIGVLPVEKVSKEKIKTTVIYGCMKNANLNEQYHEKYINYNSVILINKLLRRKQ
jgi:hypothetical protein